MSTHPQWIGTFFNPPPQYRFPEASDPPLPPTFPKILAELYAQSYPEYAEI